jgi:hypothetical protein
MDGGSDTPTGTATPPKVTSLIRPTEELDKRAPISVKFEIPYFTVSGIQVRYLKIVEKSGYSAYVSYFLLVESSGMACIGQRVEWRWQGAICVQGAAH